MKTLSFHEFSELSKIFRAVPLHREMMADMLTPVSLFQRLKDHFPDSKCFLFESVEHGTNISRYSFVGYGPVESLVSKNGSTWIQKESIELNPEECPEPHYLSDDFYTELTRFLERYKAPEIDNLPSFTGGLVGYSSYDTIRQVDPIGEFGIDDLHLPDAVWSFYDKVFAFDHVYQKLFVIHLVLLEGNETEAELKDFYQHGLDTLEGMKVVLRSPELSDRSPFFIPEEPSEKALIPTSSTTHEQFLSMVEKAKQYIFEGDAFQIVLSQRFELPFNGTSVDLYRSLRVINPSPYLFCLDLVDFQLIGSSPEILVQSNKGEITLLPIAGTRPRGETIQEDLAMEKNLLSDEKEIAEHTMLIDLGRNDLSRVCSSGSVRMMRELTIERFSHVMHIVSEIKGVLKDGKTSADALKSCFPAGTVSGAPKIRAMQIIEELEPFRRGPYAGAVGYFDLSGNMDTCITIRTICLVNRKAYIQAGAGIVADSDPQKEYEETRHKAGALFRAVELAQQIHTLA